MSTSFFKKYAYMLIIIGCISSLGQVLCTGHNGGGGGNGTTQGGGDK